MAIIGPDDPRYLEMYYTAWGGGGSIRDCNLICVTAYPYPLMGSMIGSYTEIFTVS